MLRLDLAARLGELAAKLGAVRDAFESVQDAVDLPGLLTWHAELAHVVAANLAAEMRGCACACTGSPFAMTLRRPPALEIRYPLQGCHVLCMRPVGRPLRAEGTPQTSGKGMTVDCCACQADEYAALQQGGWSL